MKDRAEGMVWASFAADSLALGAHWIYDTAVIDSDLGRVDRLRHPPENSFHRTKKAGDFTHYGDQSLVLMESIAAKKGFDLEHFAQGWRSFMHDYTGYRDHATKDTLKNFSAGKTPATSGSGSSDLGGAVRIAPLVYALRGDRAKLLPAARQQTAMTHNDPLVLESAEFLTDALLNILTGSPPVTAIEEAVAGRPALQNIVEKGLESRGRDTRATIKAFGQTCDTSAALPGVIHLVAVFEDDLVSALVENVMSGGDSAARGMAVGMLLGAHVGPAAIPAQWLKDLKACNRIAALLKDIS